MPANFYCDGVRRRDFLKVGVLGGVGLTLPGYLRMLSAGEVAANRAKSAIFINLGGGPSHMDMFDLKPDAPAEFRGEFNPIKTNVPGVEICEHLPQLAKVRRQVRDPSRRQPHAGGPRAWYEIHEFRKPPAALA